MLHLLHHYGASYFHKRAVFPRDSLGKTWHAYCFPLLCQSSGKALDPFI